jgi:DeoR/GlpR family transcriptional regulator of sugar metabolism
MQLHATVVTHSPDIVVALSDHPGIEVDLVGGRIYKHSNVAVGASQVRVSPTSAPIFRR